MDPFLKMQCQGEKLNTEEFMYLGKAVHRRRETVDPMWYFTWEADLSLPTLELQRYFPQVCTYWCVLFTAAVPARPARKKLVFKKGLGLGIWKCYIETTGAPWSVLE